MRPWFGLTVFGGICAVASCNLVADSGGYSLGDQGAGATGTTAVTTTGAGGVGTGTTSAGGAGGMVPECGMASECLAVPDCRVADCSAGKCVYDQLLPKDEGCSNDRYCDEFGGCTQYCRVGSADCGANNDCIEGVCASCTNAIKDANETDLNCGGACPPCADAKNCLDAGDCESGFCDGTECARCSNHPDCDTDEYCAVDGDMSCRLLKPVDLTSTCQHNYECTTNCCTAWTLVDNVVRCSYTGC